MAAKIDQLIINSPYAEPRAHWRYERETRSFIRESGRRPAGYVVATEGSKSFDDPGEFRPLPLVNQVRPRVKAWREAGYPGVTGITKRLLEHWCDAEQREGRRFFFCQLEAIETLIWLAEAPAAERQGIEIPSDGGPFKRVCSKMATGSGKTIVMAKPKTRIEPLPEKRKFEFTWPNIVRIDHVYQPRVELNMAKVKPLELDAGDTATQAELAPYLEGKPDVRHLSEIELESLARKFRMQRIIFEAARDVFDQMKPSWKGSQECLLAQLIGLIERFIQAGRIVISPPAFDQDDLRRRLILTLNMNKLVQHIWEEIRFENSQALTPVFDTEKPIRSTGDMRPWYTGKPCGRTKKSHINFCVFDSTWEASEAFELDRNRNVTAWVKNDHLGFEILYVFRGVVHKFRPDFLIRMTSELMLILEIKGQDTQQDQTKREFLDEWVRALNEHGGFCRWAWAVSRHPSDVKQILETHSRSN